MFAIQKISNFKNVVAIIIFLKLRTVVGWRMNLALFKRAYLSSVSNESYARYATDGIIFGTFAQTAEEDDDGWLVVDLGRPYRVESVLVHTPDCFKCDQADKFIIGLSKSFDPHKASNRDYKLCVQYGGSLMPGAKVEWQCEDREAYSRYVIIQPEIGKRNLRITELEVFGQHINYIGCFQSLSKSKVVGLLGNLEECIRNCESMNFFYAGIVVTECICGNGTKHYSPLAGCDIKCSGDIDYCGGPNKLSVYEVYTNERGSDIFKRKHNCKDGVGLDLDGICRNKQCEDGWTGEDCTSRSCSINNGDCGVHACQTFHGTTGNLSECICEKGYDKSHWRDYCLGNAS